MREENNLENFCNNKNSVLLDGLLKLFEKTLDKMVKSLEEKKNIIIIAPKLFESHYLIMMEISNDLKKNFDLHYKVIKEENGVSEIELMSQNYDELLSVIKDIQLYTKFQTSTIKGKA